MLSVLVLDSLLVLKVCKQSRCASSWQLYSYKYAFSATVQIMRVVYSGLMTLIFMPTLTKAHSFCLSQFHLPLVPAIRACVLDFMCVRVPHVRAFVRFFVIFQSSPNFLCSRVRHARSYSENSGGKICV